MSGFEEYQGTFGAQSKGEEGYYSIAFNPENPFHPDTYVRVSLLNLITGESEECEYRIRPCSVLWEYQGESSHRTPDQSVACGSHTAEARRAYILTLALFEADKSHGICLPKRII